jgi:O-6-methylguanine DNA methyltransferase
MTYVSLLSSPVDTLKISANEQGITEILYTTHPDVLPNPNVHTEEAVRQLTEYFAGQRQQFELPLDPIGTEFQKKVWQELCCIPFGSTISYAQLANRIHNPKAVRAVGGANGKNPISIVVPCHRVIGSKGTLTGYAGGLHRKAILLEFEGALAPSQHTLF